MPESRDPKKRVSGLGPHDIFLLDQWCRQLREAFAHPELRYDSVYLVGSCARDEPFRDVDVRMVMPPRLFVGRPLARRAVHLGLTLWGRQATGLPIDFQFQTKTEFHKHDGEVRNPMGSRSKTKWEGIGFG